MQRSSRPSSLLGLLWRQNHYFLWVWLALSALVLTLYHTNFDRERICTYQYCPSDLVLFGAVGCLVFCMVWVNIFFSFLRPYLQLVVGGFLGLTITEGRGSQSLLEIVLSGTNDELWDTAEDTALGTRVLVAVLDFTTMLVFLVLPITIFIAAASGLAYLEQINSPPPPGLSGLGTEVAVP